MTNFSSTSLKIIILHLDVTSVVTRILLKALSSNSSSTKEFGCKQTRSESRSQRGSSSGVLVAKCIFCNCIKLNLLAARESFMMRICYLKLVVHGSGPNFTALEGKYHKACYRTYLNKVRLSSANKNSQLKKKASAALLKHVDKLVIKQNVPILVSSLLKTYKDFFLSYGGDIAVLVGYTVQNMCRKLNKHMGNVITVASNKKKTGTIVYKTDAMSFQQALQLVATSQESAQNTIQECTKILHTDILTLEKTPLNTRSVDTIMKGEVSIPDNVNFSSESYTVETRGKLVHRNKDSLILVRLMRYTAVLGQNSFLVSISLMH